MSGEALTTAKLFPSELTASESCVRTTYPGLPSRTATQFGQPQFHCGNAPPAADPRTTARMASMIGALPVYPSAPAAWTLTITYNVGKMRPATVPEKVGWLTIF